MVVRLQLLDRHFYEVQIPRMLQRVPLKLNKTRLHFLNQNYLIIFDLLNYTKFKVKVGTDASLWPLKSQHVLSENEPYPDGANSGGSLNLWNQQSLELNGRIYMTGGAVAGTKTYLRTTTYLDETSWNFMGGLADMNHPRDAHGMISWRNRYLIVVGSWHVETSTRTCEIFDTVTNKWHILPELNEGTCAPGLIIVKDRYLYKLGGTTDIGKVEMLDLELVNFSSTQTKKKRRRNQLYEGLRNESSTDEESLVRNRLKNQEFFGGDVEMRGDEEDDNFWVTITTCNKMGRKATINRCLLFP